MNDKEFEAAKDLFYDDKALNLLSIVHKLPTPKGVGFSCLKSFHLVNLKRKKNHGVLFYILVEKYHSLRWNNVHYL